MKDISKLKITALLAAVAVFALMGSFFQSYSPAPSRESPVGPGNRQPCFLGRLSIFGAQKTGLTPFWAQGRWSGWVQSGRSRRSLMPSR